LFESKTKELNTIKESNRGQQNELKKMKATLGKAEKDLSRYQAQLNEH